MTPGMMDPKAHLDAINIIGGCHTLTEVNNLLVGDPLEKTAFEALQWKYDSKKEVSVSEDKSTEIKTVKRFLFDSSLKRMSVVAQFLDKSYNGKTYKVLCKGAPEVLKTLIKCPPDHYDKFYNYYVKHGYRVLALGFKDIEGGH